MTTELILLCIAAFLAGFVDAISGGGGLIQTPAALILLPQYPVSVAIATIKLPSFSGTAIASIQFARKVKLNGMRLAAMTAISFCAAIAGSKLLTVVSNSFFKPLLLVILTGVAIYTYTNKNFGAHTAKDHTNQQQWVYSIIISLVLGFYDGFIGPGTGSFLILAFITLMGFDFLHASAHSKFVNMASNFGSLLFFMVSGKILYAITLPMAACNALGGFMGARMAILRGNAFIRIVFLTVVILTILRFAWDVFR